MKRIIVLAIILLAGAINTDAYSQRYLSESEKEEYAERILDVVNDFNSRVAEIWRRPNGVEKENMQKFNAAKRAQVTATLNLFIGKGKSYTEDVVVSRWNGHEYVNEIRTERHDPVMMQTSSVNRRNITKQTVEAYLNRAANALGSQVTVSACDAYFTGELHPIGPGKYEATVAFVQDFIRYNAEGRITYADKTTKTIRVTITEVQRSDTKVFKVELGDIRVVSTERL